LRARHAFAACGAPEKDGMAKRMLIDATHTEETRVVVVTGNRLEEFDFESSRKKQIKGNIYLAKVTRVEPSLQAAFVEYGGNRHGFLAFGEIHPDYYRIPVADREALNRLVAEAVADQEEDFTGETESQVTAEDRAELRDDAVGPEAESGDGQNAPLESRSESDADMAPLAAPGDPGSRIQAEGEATSEFSAGAEAPIRRDLATGDTGEPETAERPHDGANEDAAPSEAEAAEPAVPEPVETMGGDDVDDIRRRHRLWHRRYKIQEVIRKRQILLVQVAKEERGNKGAALTTYISLAGRYCVLMPNTPRGGGISRKITNQSDRRRLKEMLTEFDLPEGMAVIVRTAGMERSQQELRRDLDFLLKTWSDIREKALTSTAPALIYEEANLIKRSIRDLFAQEVDEIIVDGHEGFLAAKSYMSLMMPSHSKRVVEYTEKPIPLFHRYQVESQIDNMHSSTVQLRSGGYVVLNPTEALVAIDVNSGRSTRERNIEETAYRTNLEAADEIARQLRLRDLAGLIVIDFIDMEEGRYRHNVERRLKEALKQDRARIQVGRISPFGLLEMSRQRLRPSLVEASMMSCPHCGGAGHVRSTESMALTVLRAIEEEGLRQRSAEVTVALPTTVALYIFNQKRTALSEIEARHGFRVVLQPDDTQTLASFRIARTVAKSAEARQAAERQAEPRPAPAPETERAGEPDGERLPGHEPQPGGERRSDHQVERLADEPAEDEAAGAREPAEARGREEDDDRRDGEDRDRRGRRRGRRGGRRRRGRQRGEGDTGDARANGGDEVETERRRGNRVSRDDAESVRPQMAAANAEEDFDADRRIAVEDAPERPRSMPLREAEAPAGEAEPARIEAAWQAPAHAEPQALPASIAAASAEPAAAAPAEPSAARPVEAPASDAAVTEAASTEPAKPARRGWWSLRRG
jgi:ribonuclease E